MKQETIVTLKAIIEANDSRLARLATKLDNLKGAVLAAESAEELCALQNEFNELKAEIDELLVIRERLKKEVNSFYKPAA